MPRIATERLDVVTLNPLAAAALKESAVDRAERIVGAEIGPEFLATDVMDIMGLQAGLAEGTLSWGVWLILERDPALVVGSAGFMGPPDEAGEIEIGYSVIASRQRRGYLVEAATALLDWALARPDVAGVRARCLADNVASIRSLQRLGFARTGQSGEYLSWRLGPGAPAPGG